MSLQENYAYAKFGIDEIYIHPGLDKNLLEKLHRRAAFTLDGEDNLVSKHATHDMILIFYKKELSPSMIYRFLQFLSQDPKKADFIESNTLLNEDELFAAIKEQTFVLVTPKLITSVV